MARMVVIAGVVLALVGIPACGGKLSGQALGGTVDAGTGTGGYGAHGGSGGEPGLGGTPALGGTSSGGATGGTSSGGATGGTAGASAGGSGGRPVPPDACPAQGPVAPLDDGCAEPICHVAIRLAYETLAIRGYASMGGRVNVITAQQAGALAQGIFVASSQYLYGTGSVEPPIAGMYRSTISPTDFGAVALVGEQSGIVVMAGGVIYAGSGEYWVPTTWQSSSAVSCGDTPVSAVSTFLDTAQCDWYGGPNATAPSASDALDVALRTNLALHYSQQGSLSAYVLLYTPRVGGCDPALAEYVVVLTHD